MSMKSFARTAIVLPILLSTVSAFGTEPESLIKLVPHAANTVGVIRINEILESPLARSEQWIDRRDELFGGATQVPPWADVVVLAGLVHPTVPEEAWTVAFLPMSDDIDMKTIAWHEGSPVQELAGFSSVRSRRGAYLVQVAPNVLAVRTPGARQQTARWLRTVAAGTVSTPEYLSQAAASANQILLALDMADALDPTLMSQRLDELSELKGQHTRHDQLLKTIVGLRGVRFLANIDEAINSRVILDFADELSKADAPHLQTLFLTVLNDLQAEVEELNQAAITVDGRSLVLSTELSPTSLRRVMSLLISPAPTETASSQNVSDRTARSRVEPTEEQTARYFAAVTGIVDDLQRVNRKAKDYLRTATWHDNFAKRIDQLSIAGVEARVVDFGAEMASRLRALAASLRGVAVEVDTQRRSITYDTQIQSGWAAWNVWGGYGYRPGTWKVSSNLQEIRERIAAAVADGAKEREQIWGFITDKRQALTRDLIDKYGPNFPKRRRRSTRSSPPSSDR